MKKYIIGLGALLSVTIAPSFVLALTISGGGSGGGGGNLSSGDVDPNPSSSQCLSLQNNLRYRMKDANTNGEVSPLQDFLASENYLNSEPTGYFGLMTFRAAKDFQKDNNLSPTGYVGPMTRAKIKDLTCGTGTTTPPLTAPIINSFSPASVLVGTNARVRVYGNNLSSVNGVRLVAFVGSTTPYTEFSPISNTEIEILTPNNLPVGSYHLVVISPSGSSGASSALKVVASTTPPVPSAGLTVALSPDTQSAGVLVEGQKNVNLASFTFTNKGSTGANITGLVFTRLGISNDATLSNVYLYYKDEAIVLTNPVSVTQAKISFNFNYITGIYVPAGASKTISVKADVASGTAGQIVGVSLTSVTANAAVSSALPVSGNLQTIVNLTTPAPSSPITVISPNGGETWMAGKTYPIKWKGGETSGPNAWVQIGIRDTRYSSEISKGEVAIVSSTDNTGVYYWTVPQIGRLGDMIFDTDFVNKIVVYAGTNQPNADTSDNVFAAGAGIPSCPTGQCFNSGRECGVCPAPSTLFNDTAAVLGGDSTPTPTPTPTPAPVLVPSPVPAPIPVPVTKSITVTSQSVDGNWYYGTPRTIRWTSAGVNLVNITLEHPTNGTVIKVASGVDASKGFYTWTVPSGAPSAHFRVFVRGANSSAFGKSSGIVYITSASASVEDRLNQMASAIEALQGVIGQLTLELKSR